MNSLNSENKQHYKMYKKEKVWLFASILSFTLFTGLASVNVNADDNSSQKEAVDVNTDDKNHTPEPAALPTDGQYSSSDNGSTWKYDSNKSSRTYESAGDGFVYKNQDGSVEKGLQSVDNNIQYFDQNTGIQAKNNVQNIGGQNSDGGWSYYDANSVDRA